MEPKCAQFEKNTSEQFEARLTGVKISDSKSIFFSGMEGSIMPIAIAHGEGKARFDSKTKIGARSFPSK